MHQKSVIYDVILTIVPDVRSVIIDVQFMKQLVF
jgi:hypothetical protein